VAGNEEAGCGEHCRTRRSVLGLGAAAGAVVALSACSAYGSGNDSDGSGDKAPAPAASAGAALGNAADVPLNGGKIFQAQGIVVTQPSAGSFRAFTIICPHAGCEVNAVTGGTINCPCHGSKFNINDGGVAGGPAPKGLTEKKIVVDGDVLKLA
jgi:Rieske Fe-S protein